MTSTVILALVLLGILVLVSAGLGVAYYVRHRELRRRFGPEYDRLASGRDGPLAIDRHLRDRERQHAQLSLKDLDSDTRDWYGEQWQRVQARFVESPESAIGAADELVTHLIAERGYPIRDYDEQVALLSVEHARVIDDYRVAHDIAQQHARGGADTEMLRQALMHYRVLVADILGTDHGLKAEALPDPAHPGEAPVMAAQPSASTLGDDPRAPHHRAAKAEAAGQRTEPVAVTADPDRTRTEPTAPPVDATPTRDARDASPMGEHEDASRMGEGEDASRMGEGEDASRMHEREDASRMRDGEDGEDAEGEARTRDTEVTERVDRGERLRARGTAKVPQGKQTLEPESGARQPAPRQTTETDEDAISRPSRP